MWKIKKKIKYYSNYKHLIFKNFLLKDNELIIKIEIEKYLKSINIIIYKNLFGHNFFFFFFFFFFKILNI